MPRKYKTKEGSKKRKPIDKEKLKKAVAAVLAGGTLKGTSKQYDIPLMTLKRYARRQKEANEEIEYNPNYRQAMVFSQEEETELVKYLETACKLYHGLTPKNVRALAYQYAKANDKEFPDNWELRQEASYDWFWAFMNRNLGLSLRKPEATSLSRATSFNRHNVQKFFENLRSLMTRFNFEPQQIYNVDETGITTVHKPKKIVACRGLKQVSKVTSAERGELVTVCSAINASGNHLPPFMIFPRKKWQARMIHNAPPGSDGAPNISGWMTVTTFMEFLKHFQKHVRASKENPCLLIFDNHESHISIESVQYAKDHGIHLLTIPPHTSQKLQPLDRILFGCLKSHYDTACDDWMASHPGTPITIYEIAGLLGRAYPLAMTPRNIVKSFEVTGIYPLNSDIFTDDEYLSSYVTDRPQIQGLDRLQQNEVEQTNRSEETNRPQEYQRERNETYRPNDTESQPRVDQREQTNRTNETDRPREDICEQTDRPNESDKPRENLQKELGQPNETHRTQENKKTKIDQPDKIDRAQEVQPNEKDRSQENEREQTDRPNETDRPREDQQKETNQPDETHRPQENQKTQRDQPEMTDRPQEDQTNETDRLQKDRQNQTDQPNEIDRPNEDQQTQREQLNETDILQEVQRKQTDKSHETDITREDQQEQTDLLNETERQTPDLQTQDQTYFSDEMYHITGNSTVTSLTAATECMINKDIGPKRSSTVTGRPYFSPEIIRPHPKAGPRKTVKKGRKKGATKILTDTPEKEALEKDHREKEEKKKAILANKMKRNLSKTQLKSTPKAKKQKIQEEESSSDEENIILPPSPGSEYAVEDDEDEKSESEEEDNGDNDDIHEGDWVVVNLTSEKNLVHRYVGQITKEYLASLDVKFAKKVNDKKFKWPEKTDTSLIGKYQVVKKLPLPHFKSSS